MLEVSNLFQNNPLEEESYHFEVRVRYLALWIRLGYHLALYGFWKLDPPNDWGQFCVEAKPDAPVPCFDASQ